MTRDAEIAEDARPRAGAVFVEQTWRRDDEAAPVELECEQRRHERLAQADHVRDEDPAVGLEHLLGGEHRVLLITQLFEILRQVYGVQLRAVAEVIAEVFGEKPEIKFVGREERKGRLLLHGGDDCIVDVLHIDAVPPQLVEAMEGVVVLLRLGEEHIELQIPL